MASYSSRKCVFNVPSKPFRRETGPRHPSLDLRNVPIATDDSVLRVRQYDSAMLERERIAQAEIAYKRTCIAPLVNKGAYQYITPGTDIQTIGRK